jgi:molecular chaperone DnaJ
MARNFYVVLGISPDSDLQQIQSAYRRLAKKYHPDTGHRPAEQFLEVQQAYQTLSDDKKRRLHDQEQDGAAAATPPGINLVSVHPRAPGADQTPFWEEQEGFFSAVDEFFAGWVPGLFRPAGRGLQRKDLYVELILEPGEATAGGLFPLQVPVEHSCAACGGSGVTGHLTCAGCGGGGRTVRYHPIEIAVPRGVANRTRVRLSLDSLGLGGVELNVLVTVTS